MSPTLGLLRWVLLRAASTPIACLAFILSAALWVGILVLTPIGLTTGSRGATPLIYELAFLAQLAGVAFTLELLAQNRWLFEILPPGKRVAMRFEALLAGGALGLIAGTLIPALCTKEPLSAAFLAGALTTLVHLAALGLWLSRAPLPGGLRSLALPLLAWLLPGAAGTDDPAGRILHRVLDASKHLAAEAPTDALAFFRTALPVAALIAGAALLELPGARDARVLQRDSQNPRDPGPIPAP